MKKRFDPIKALIHALEGAIVGVGAILPGVSGGVLCVSFGVYEPLMEVLTEPKKALKKHYEMFIPFLVGWALGFVLLAGVMEAFFSFAPDVAIMLFFGLVCGTLPELFKKIKWVTVAKNAVERAGKGKLVVAALYCVPCDLVRAFPRA